MATVTHYIRSEYDPEIDKARLLRETGQIDDHPVDHWHTESSSAGFHKSNRLAPAPIFVSALLPYDQWASPGTFASPAEPTSTDDPGDVATWYRSLSRQGPNPAQLLQPPSSESSPCGSPPSQVLDAAPEPSPASTTHAATTTTLSFSSPRPLLVAPSPQHRDRGRRNWFTSRATSPSAPPPTTTKTPPGPPSSSGGSLADILSRNPPAATQPLRPPVFLHLGPSNRGWAMLQSQGWTEGEGLGAAASTRTDDARVRAGTTWQTSRRRTDGGEGGAVDERWGRLDSPGAASTSPPPQTPRTVEAASDEDDDEADDDDIVEVLRKAPVPLIDLTQSDTEDQEGEEEHPDPVPEPEHGGRPDDTPATPILDPNNSFDPRAAQTALLTPLPTVLKSDRLGIGLKAKTEGPHRSSVKRVTHNAAALAAHARAAEDMRRAQRRFGKGRRAFARTERLERESRQNMMAYLSEP